MSSNKLIYDKCEYNKHLEEMSPLTSLDIVDTKIKVNLE